MAWPATDLDQRPELITSTLPLFAARPGQEHLVCGLPHRMGQPVSASDLRACLGVLVLLERIRPVAALGLCAYSPEQITLWGPAVLARPREAAVRQLMALAREALRDGGYASLRLLVDTRNRIARADALAVGLTAWKDTHCYESALRPMDDAALAGLRVAAADDHALIVPILDQGFPDSDHCRPNLVQREDAGYRHYLLTDAGQAVGAAAVQRDGRRAWLKLIAVAGHARGRGFGARLLRGVMASEQRLGASTLGLEVLADNLPANAIYRAAGMQRLWTATIFSGPV